MKRLLVIVTALLLPLVFGFSSVAHAGTSCEYPYCSQTYNQTRDGVLVARNWCTNATAIVRNDPPPCRDQTTQWLGPDDYTNPHEDWDTFRVDAGWRYTYRTHSVLVGWGPVTVIDRRGYNTGVWIKVRNDESAYIMNQQS